MNTKQTFLWPDAEPLRLSDFSGISKSVTHGKIEKLLDTFYPGGNGVLFSSARAALNAVLQLLNVSRPDLVWCPPYSSHCVFDAISRQATPCTRESDRDLASVAVLFHQWGFQHKAEFPEQVCIIEDAADTLFMPGANLFGAGGDFTLISLPKVIASHFGGVVFCRRSQDAEKLRAIRNSRCNSKLWQALLKLLSGYSERAGLVWHGTEAVSGELPFFARHQIWRQLMSMESLVKKRRELLESLSPNILRNADSNGRIPSVIPLDKSTVPLELWRGETPLISTGFRNFNTALSAPYTRWESCAPMPVHQTVPKNIVSLVKAGDVRDLLNLIN